MFFDMSYFSSNALAIKISETDCVRIHICTSTVSLLRSCSVSQMCYLHVLRLRKTDTKAQCCPPDFVFREARGLEDSLPPWYSLVEPKPLYDSSEAKTYWDMRVHLLQNRGRSIRQSHGEDSNSSGDELSDDPSLENRMEKDE